MEEKLKKTEEEKMELKEKVQAFEEAISEGFEDEEEVLDENNKIVERNDDYIEEIEIFNQVLNNEKEIQSNLEINLVNLSTKDGSITRDNIIDEDNPSVYEGEKISD